MQSANYITASLVICHNEIFKNETLWFENKGAGVADFLLSAYRNSGISYPKFYKMDNLAKLGWLASEILLKDSFNPEKYKPEEVGVLFSNASSSLDADLKYFESAKDIASPALFVYTLPNIVVGEICIKHKFKGESAFFIFEAFDADFIQKYATELFNNNILQACICGWVELIGEEYKAVIFLVENDVNRMSAPQNTGLEFTNENINKIYYAGNG